MAERRFSIGEYIFRIGDPADGVYRVISGEVRVERNGHRIGLHGPGDILGDSGFLVADDREDDAIAAGPVAVEFLSRNVFIERLTRSPHLLGPLIGPLFDFEDVSAFDPLDGADTAIEPHGPESGGYATVRGADLRVLLVADSDTTRAMLGQPEVLVEELPYRVGRQADGEGKATFSDVNLILSDRRPFNVSRRHFAIEDDHGVVSIRDFGSYHGTTVNGIRLGGENQPRSMQLTPGENELIVGRPESPIRFRVIVG